MYQPQRLCEGQPAYAVELAEVAHSGNLVIYTGAGLSRTTPTDLPDGAELARRCYVRLVNALGPEALNAADPSDLTSVADAVAAAADADLVRRTAGGVAEFTSATPNFSHEILALLLLEGFLDAITTNWDDCIERAGGDERVLAVISDQDRQQIDRTALLKVHGCATRPTTLLITTQDLANPPPWARDAVNGRVAESVIAFVGIGDVAGYVRERIKEAMAAVGTQTSVFVVSPSIDATWEESQWAELLPQLTESRRIASTSDAFLDHVAAACVRRMLREISEALQREQGVSAAFERARAAFEQQTSLAVLRWLRCCPVPRSPGSSAMRQQAFSSALIALGILGEQSGVVLLQGGRVTAGAAEYEVLIACGTVGTSKLRREAETRLVRQRSEGEGLAERAFLVAGGLGRIDSVQGLPGSVLDDLESDDVVAGPLAVSPTLIRAEDLVA